MARIRILDEWIRSPASPVIRRRAVVVVADGWAEQRVLMRAYAGARDQLCPTIKLHGGELAIGPAGTDAYGPWGIHVEPPLDGRAQELRGQLEVAAQRMAGSKGNPPRLLDELPRFESQVTHHWAPGTPRDRKTPAPVPGTPRDGKTPAPSLAPGLTLVQPPRPNRAPLEPRSPKRDTSPLFTMSPPSEARRGWENPLRTTANSVGSTTAPGFRPSGATPRPLVPSVSRPQTNNLASLVGRTLPVGFRLTPQERNVLNVLGRSDGLSMKQIGEIAGASNAAGWMSTFIVRLQEHGLDIIQEQPGPGGEPVYVLRK